MKRKNIIITSFVAGILLLSVTPYVKADVTDIQLPPTPVMMSLTHNWDTSYFLVTLSDVPDGFDVTNNDYIGWCADPTTFIDISISHQVMLYSSYSALPSHLDNPAWDKVNYLINHKQGNPSSWNYFWEIQFAIWYILGYGDQGMEFIGYPMNAIAWAMVNEANAIIGEYTPSPGEVVGIVADSGSDVQGVFFEISVPETFEGLTPGFWMNHHEAWIDTGYNPDNQEQLVGDVFIVPGAFAELGGLTLDALLHRHKEPGLQGAALILLFHAIAALLNTAHPDISYPMTEAEIIGQVNSALASGASGNRHAMLTLKDTLEAYNILGSDDF